MKVFNLMSVLFLSLFTTLIYAQPNTSLVFNASEENSLVECGVLSEDLSNFTVETRVSFSSLASGNYLVCNEGWGDAAEGFVLRVSDNKPSFTMGVASGWKDVKGTTTLEIDKWYHIAVSFDGTDLKLYVDGLLESTSQPGEMLNQSGQSLVLGEGAAWKGRRLDGELSDVRIWNTARTLQEIADNKDAYLTSVPSGLIANWQMSEGSGTSLSDFVGTYNSTIGAAVVWGAVITEDLQSDDEQSFHIYPNPVSSTLTISSHSVDYTILNETGKVLKIGVGNEVSVIDLNVGVYYLRIGQQVSMFVKR